MRTFSRRTLSILLVALLFSACQPIQPPTPAPTDTPLPSTPTTVPTDTPLPPTPAPQVASPPPEKILFIGNSFTNWNLGINEHLEKMVALSEPPSSIDTRTSILGGGTLKMHWDGGGAARSIQDGGYDAVVLQGDIPEIVEHDVEQFYEHVRRFDQEIKNAGAQTVLYMTWEYQRLDWIDTDGIVAAHRVAAEETGAKVAPVGLAWQRAAEERPDLNLYDSDNEHPSILGTFLALNVLYATLFEQSPIGHPYRLEDFVPHPDTVPEASQKMAQQMRDELFIAEEDAEFLQHIAWETVQEYRAMP